ncbi:uncharacterized protein LOC110698406 [Chenopodium quinoa]|uniref:uncharacterized protein LOC110698406 n=1 Tax=Chenopodium quinoa TaxID=63459 RepID=UPI000B780FDD|nr:uncharacterized protein LOC110698406 [Chenopodium quinoa]
MQRKLGRGWAWADNYSCSQKGRIWIGWKNDRLTLQVLSVNEKYVHCIISSKDFQKEISCTFVYGLHSIHDRKDLWAGIRGLHTPNLPWLCAGDFNSILHTDDKLNGTEVTNYEIRDFRQFIDYMEFLEIKSKGFFYSWSNKVKLGLRTCTRIDRGLVNQNWLTLYAHVEAIYLASSLSDHSLMLFDVFTSLPGKGRPFRFLNCIASHTDFNDAIKEAWDHSGYGSVMGQVWNKLKSVKAKVKELNINHFSNVLMLLRQLWKRSSEILKIYVQENIYKQKSRVEWIKLGDGNTHYFFSIMKHRQSVNRIDSIYTTYNTLLKKPDEEEHEIVGFYKNLMGSAASSLPVVDLVTLRNGRQLSVSAQQSLIADVTTGEIDEAIKGIEATKAPGIDGFNSFFFHKSWHIIKNDIYVAVFEFFRTGVMFKAWNCTAITLVPKV